MSTPATTTLTPAAIRSQKRPHRKINKVDTKLEVNAKKLLERAITQRTPLILFIDKYGEQVAVGLAPSDPESDAFRLIDELSLFSPSFQICTTIDGFLTNWDGDPISIEDLPKAIKAAEDERNRFYTEKEKQFGARAWPCPKG